MFASLNRKFSVALKSEIYFYLHAQDGALLFLARGHYINIETEKHLSSGFPFVAKPNHQFKYTSFHFTPIQEIVHKNLGALQI